MLKGGGAVFRVGGIFKINEKKGVFFKNTNRGVSLSLSLSLFIFSFLSFK